MSDTNMKSWSRPKLIETAQETFPTVSKEVWNLSGITNTELRQCLTVGRLPSKVVGYVRRGGTKEYVHEPEVRDALEVLAARIQQGQVDPDLIREQVRQEMAEITPVAIVQIATEEDVIEEIMGQHALFPKLLDIVILREEGLLYGPPGVGKSFAAKAAAEAAKLEYGELSVGPTTTESKLLGYQDAQGRYVSTEFRQRYEHGGLFLLDETDNGNGAVLAVLNNALSTGRLAFPDGVVDRHKDFVLIATANTVGHGATREFLGRQPLDAAFRDRFVVIDWQVDEQLESAIAFARGDALKVDSSASEAWIERVRKVRKAIEESGQVRVLATPRAIFKGIGLLARSWSLPDIEEAVLWKGCQPEIRTKVEACIG